MVITGFMWLIPEVYVVFNMLFVFVHDVADGLLDLVQLEKTNMNPYDVDSVLFLLQRDRMIP